MFAGMAAEFVEYETLDSGRIARIWLNRPEAHNAQNRTLLVQLDEAFKRAEFDDTVRVIILAARGKNFSAGHDLGSEAALAERTPGPGLHPSFTGNGATRDGMAEKLMIQEWHYYYDNTMRWRNLRKITIAQVQGNAIAAALMLIWACDLIVAADDARFSDVVAVRLGMPGVEYFAHPWEFGPRKAKELLLTGDALDADEAYRLGMVSKVFPADELTENRLEQLWRQVDALHGAGVVHLDLTLDHVVLTGDGDIALTSFGSATVGDRHDYRLHDVATLLVATSEVVGADRAVAAAAFGIGRERLAAVLPVLQSAVLPSALRPGSRSERSAFTDRLSVLRSTAAAAVEVEPPRLTEMHRISGATLAMVIGTFLGVAALLSQVGDPQELWDTMAAADWEWVSLAIVVSLLTNFSTAMALMGSVPIRIPLLRTAELQLSLSFANLAVPTVGGLASQVRYLQKQGVDLAGAVAAGGVVSGVANVVVTSSVCLLAILLSPAKIATEPIEPNQLLGLLLIAAVIIGAVCGIVFGVPRIRAHVLAPVRNAWAIVSSALRSPRQLGQLVFGWAANALMYAFVLYCCVAAFGPPVNFWTIVLINTGVSTLAFAVPVPGGATAVSSVGVAGLLTAVGASQEVAVAASLAYQVTATFIPAVPGWFCFRNLMAHDFL